MTDPLKCLWPYVDDAKPVFTQAMVETWPAQVHKRLVDLGLLRRAHNADKIRCPNCHNHYDEVITCDGPGGEPRFFIYCPETLRVEITPDRLRQWRIDVNSLVALLAKALSPDAEPQILVFDAAWRLGHLPISGVRYNVVFLRTAWGEEYTRTVEQLARLSPPAKTILLVSSRIRDDAGAIKDFAGRVLMEHCSRLRKDAIYLDTDRLLESVGMDPWTAPFVFHQEGDMWTVRFEGRCVHMADSVGLAYIARLLSEPDRDIPAVTLLAARAGIDPLIASGSSGELLDDKARKDYSNLYTELQDDLSEAREHNDFARLEQLETEMEQLATQLANATGLGGRKRQQSDAEKVRKSVSMAVTRAIKSINGKHKSLGRHLLAAISSGQVFRYAPPSSIDWLT